MSGDERGARAGSMHAYRLVVAARVILAVLGSYTVAALASALLALILPGTRAEAVSAAVIASFAVMAAAVIGIFAARTVRRAAWVLGLVAALVATALWLAGGFQTGVAA